MDLRQTNERQEEGNTAVSPPNSSKIMAVAVSCMGALVGGVAGLIIAIAIIALLWLLGFGLLLTAPPLEFMGSIEEMMASLFWLSVALLIGGPLLAGVIGGIMGGTTTAIWQDLRHGRGHRKKHTPTED